MYLICLISYTNSAYSFDGWDDYIDAGTSTLTLFDSWNSFTVVSWINPAESSTYECIVGRHDDRAPSFNYDIFVGTDNRIALVVDQAHVDSMSVTSMISLDDGIWNHVVGICDNKNMTIYVNGIEVVSVVFPAGGEGDPLAPLYIGGGKILNLMKTDWIYYIDRDLGRKQM